MDAPAIPLVSPELLAANQRLYELRQQTQLHKAEPGQPNHSLNQTVIPWQDADKEDDSSPTAVAPVAALPSHLGWHSDAVTQAVRTALERRQITPAQETPSAVKHPAFQSDADDSHSSDQSSADDKTFPPDSPCHLPSNLNTVRHYPSIGTAALQTEQAALYRVWLLCRYLDEQGQGWQAVSDIRQQLTGKVSKLRLFGWRRLRQILGQGHNLFWHWDKAGGRLWLYGAAVVAANLGVPRLAGCVVALPIAAMTAGIGDFKAHLYAAWHSGRRRNNPISREVQVTLIGVPARTQRHYGQVARIRRQANMAIGSTYTPEEGEKQAWHRGRATFLFIDHRGRHGRKGRRYVAWHLPNSYHGPHRQTAVGRMRKINRKLKDLVIIGARGNSGMKVEKLYYANGAVAARALNRGKQTESYWPLAAMSRRSTFWVVFSLR